MVCRVRRSWEPQKQAGQQRYHELVGSKRLTLNRIFERAGWRTVGVMPAWTTDWMTDAGKAKLQEYGIAPPSGKSAEDSVIHIASPIFFSSAV